MAATSRTCALRLEFVELSDIFRGSQFKVFRGALDAGGVVKAINAKGFATITSGQIEDLTSLAKQSGARGLAFIKVEGGEWKSPIVKFFTEPEKAALTQALDIEEGDLVLFGADRWEVVCTTLGRIRLKVADHLKLIQDRTDLKFLWVLDFPLLAFDPAENKWNAMHHPFTRPKQRRPPIPGCGRIRKIAGRSIRCRAERCRDRGRQYPNTRTRSTS